MAEGVTDRTCNCLLTHRQTVIDQQSESTGLFETTPDAFMRLQQRLCRRYAGGDIEASEMFGHLKRDGKVPMRQADARYTAMAISDGRDFAGGGAADNGF